MIKAIEIGIENIALLITSSLSLSLSPMRIGSEKLTGRSARNNMGNAAAMSAESRLIASSMNARPIGTVIANLASTSLRGREVWGRRNCMPMLRAMRGTVAEPSSLNVSAAKEIEGL